MSESLAKFPGPADTDLGRCTIHALARAPRDPRDSQTPAAERIRIATRCGPVSRLWLARRAVCFLTAREASRDRDETRAQRAQRGSLPNGRGGGNTRRWPRSWDGHDSSSSRMEEEEWTSARLRRRRGFAGGPASMRCFHYPASGGGCRAGGIATHAAARIKANWLYTSSTVPLSSSLWHDELRTPCARVREGAECSMQIIGLAG